MREEKKVIRKKKSTYKQSLGRERFSIRGNGGEGRNRDTTPEGSGPQ